MTAISVAFVEPQTEKKRNLEVHQLKKQRAASIKQAGSIKSFVRGFYIPHYMQFALDSRFAYRMLTNCVRFSETSRAENSG